MHLTKEQWAAQTYHDAIPREAFICTASHDTTQWWRSLWLFDFMH